MPRRWHLHHHHHHHHTALIQQQNRRQQLSLLTAEADDADARPADRFDTTTIVSKLGHFKYYIYMYSEYNTEVVFTAE